MAKITNNLKKIQVGNPLINLEMWNLYEEHELIQTDEHLADFYHMMLDVHEALYVCNRRMPVFESAVYKMIDYSSGADVNPLFNLMKQTLEIHEN